MSNFKAKKCITPTSAYSTLPDLLDEFKGPTSKGKETKEREGAGRKGDCSPFWNASLFPAEQRPQPTRPNSGEGKQSVVKKEANKVCFYLKFSSAKISATPALIDLLQKSLLFASADNSDWATTAAHATSATGWWNPSFSSYQLQRHVGYDLSARLLPIQVQQVYGAAVHWSYVSTMFNVWRQKLHDICAPTACQTTEIISSFTLSGSSNPNDFPSNELQLLEPRQWRLRHERVKGIAAICYTVAFTTSKWTMANGL